MTMAAHAPQLGLAPAVRHLFALGQGVVDCAHGFTRPLAVGQQGCEMRHEKWDEHARSHRAQLAQAALAKHDDFVSWHLGQEAAQYVRIAAVHQETVLVRQGGKSGHVVPHR